MAMAREGFEVDASGTLIAYTDSKEEAVVEIPQGITMIDTFAFFAVENVVTIHIPDSVTSIGGFAFKGCTSLEKEPSTN